MMCRRPAKCKVGYSLKPASSSGIVCVPCGQCLNCRINQARIWTNRILLEQTQHGDSSFVTLTYDDDHLPNPPHVSKVHLQKYIKRLREKIEPVEIRYFGVGEYGDRTFRPHYHIILFGIGLMHEKVIKRAWKSDGKYLCNPDIGISVGVLNPASARYITGYITQKINKIKGTHPTCYGKTDEFMISSRGTKKNQKGGIGKSAACQIRKNFDKHRYTPEDMDINCIRVGAKKYPLGRYLKQFTEGKQQWERRLLNFKVNQERMVDMARKRSKNGRVSKEKRRPL